MVCISAATGSWIIPTPTPMDENDNQQGHSAKLKMKQYKKHVYFVCSEMLFQMSLEIKEDGAKITRLQ
jgi:hypothetical protein